MDRESCRDEAKCKRRDELKLQTPREEPIRPSPRWLCRQQRRIPSSTNWGFYLEVRILLERGCLTSLRLVGWLAEAPPCLIDRCFDPTYCCVTAPAQRLDTCDAGPCSRFVNCTPEGICPSPNRPINPGCWSINHPKCFIKTATWWAGWNVLRILWICLTYLVKKSSKKVFGERWGHGFVPTVCIGLPQFKAAYRCSRLDQWRLSWPFESRAQASKPNVVFFPKASKNIFSLVEILTYVGLLLMWKDHLIWQNPPKSWDCWLASQLLCFFHLCRLRLFFSTLSQIKGD